MSKGNQHDSEELDTDLASIQKAIQGLLAKHIDNVECIYHRKENIELIVDFFNQLQPHLSLHHALAHIVITEMEEDPTPTQPHLVQ